MYSRSSGEDVQKPLDTNQCAWCSGQHNTLMRPGGRASRDIYGYLQRTVIPVLITLAYYSNSVASIHFMCEEKQKKHKSNIKWTARGLGCVFSHWFRKDETDIKEVSNVRLKTAVGNVELHCECCLWDEMGAQVFFFFFFQGLSCNFTLCMQTDKKAQMSQFVKNCRRWKWKLDS